MGGIQIMQNMVFKRITMVIKTSAFLGLDL